MTSQARIEKPVFVPLTKEAFNDFMEACEAQNEAEKLCLPPRTGKRWEVRRAERQWNRKELRTGRSVTLSCGYSGARLRGKIGIVIFGSLEKIFGKIHFQEIEPRAWNRKGALQMNREILGKAKEYVAFEVIL